MSGVGQEDAVKKILEEAVPNGMHVVTRSADYDTAEVGEEFEYLGLSG
jgi:hypothetical protein